MTQPDYLKLVHSVKNPAICSRGETPLEMFVGEHLGGSEVLKMAFSLVRRDDLTTASHAVLATFLKTHVAPVTPSSHVINDVLCPIAQAHGLVSQGEIIPEFRWATWRNLALAYARNGTPQIQIAGQIAMESVSLTPHWPSIVNETSQLIQTHNGGNRQAIEARLAAWAAREMLVYDPAVPLDMNFESVGLGARVVRKAKAFLAGGPER